MKDKELSWEDGEKRLLKNIEVVKAIEKLEPEFQALRQLIMIRKKNKITQQRLADKTGIRQSHIARLETGEITPTLKILKLYASGLDRVLTLNILPAYKYHTISSQHK
jgi:DNA-binding XRE family transcriptional regulator